MPENHLTKIINKFINVAGLAIGISASMVIYMVVSYEFSFYAFEKNDHSHVTATTKQAARHDISEMPAIAPARTTPDTFKAVAPSSMVPAQHHVSRLKLYGLSVIAVLILSLGCINFITFTSARASALSTEFDLVETTGIPKSLVVLKFLSETFLLVVISFSLSIIFTPLLLWLLSGVVPSGVHFSSLFKPGSSLLLSLLLAVVALISGLYPVMIICCYDLLEIFKTKLLQRVTYKAGDMEQGILPISKQLHVKKLF